MVDDVRGLQTKGTSSTTASTAKVASAVTIPVLLGIEKGNLGYTPFEYFKGPKVVHYPHRLAAAARAAEQNPRIQTPKRSYLEEQERRYASDPSFSERGSHTSKPGVTSSNRASRNGAEDRARHGAFPILPKHVVAAQHFVNNAAAQQDQQRKVHAKSQQRRAAALAAVTLSAAGVIGTSPGSPRVLDEKRNFVHIYGHGLQHPLGSNGATFAGARPPSSIYSADLPPSELPDVDMAKRFYEEETAPWWNVRQWRARTWVILTVILALAIAVAVTVPIVVKRNQAQNDDFSLPAGGNPGDAIPFNSSYPAYTKLNYVLQDTCEQSSRCGGNG